MFSHSKSGMLSAGIAALGIVITAHFATANPIYSDSLGENTGTTGTSLAGQTVASSAAYAGGTLNATWQSNTAVVLENSIARTPYSGTGGSQIYLPLAVEQGYIYTLTMTMNDIRGDTTSKGFAGVGFSGGNTSGDTSFGEINDPVAWVSLRTSGSTTNNGLPQFYPGGTNTFSNGQTFGTSTDNGQQTVEITLNTTGANTAASPWTAQATLLTGSLSQSSVIDLPAAVSITNVGFGNAFDQSDFANFSLSATAAAVPEPAPIGLLAAAGLGILLLKRKRA
jgi:hypothetical protein